VCAPDYLTQQGFPLDDAWIHAVYGRELARSGMLAYNPHTPATGSTAPLWSAIVAVPHLVTSGPPWCYGSRSAGSSSMCLRHWSSTPRCAMTSCARRLALAGAVLVALHPDLLSASVSGMEVPLATLAAVGLLYAVAWRGAAAVALLAALAVLVRPELAVVALAIPLILRVANTRSALPQTVGAAGGVALAFGLLALRNLAVSGLPLPATFYAKVGMGPPLLDALRMGFEVLLRRLPIVNSLLLLGAGFGIAVLVLRRSASRAARVAAAGFISGLAFCVVSFALIAPIDPDAFYHQRYVLPALPLLIGPLPLLLFEPLAGRCRAATRRRLRLRCSPRCSSCSCAMPRRATRTWRTTRATSTMCRWHWGARWRRPRPTTSCGRSTPARCAISVTPTWST
jgi:hypothetical protein